MHENEDKRNEMFSLQALSYVHGYYQVSLLLLVTWIFLSDCHGGLDAPDQQ